MSDSPLIDALVAGPASVQVEMTPGNFLTRNIHGSWSVTHEVSPGVLVTGSRWLVYDKRDKTTWRDTVVDGVLLKQECLEGEDWVEMERVAFEADDEEDG